MKQKKAEQKDISDKLRDAIEGLRKDTTRVEIWATALRSFAQPIPDYRPNPKFELGQPVATGSLAEKDSEKQPGTEPGTTRERPCK